MKNEQAKSRFEIRIVEHRTTTQRTRGAYTVIDQRPFTDAELNDGGYYRQSEDYKKGALKPIYGYAPDREEEVEEEIALLTQNVEQLDIGNIIRAINKI